MSRAWRSRFDSGCRDGLSRAMSMRPRLRPAPSGWPQRWDWYNDTVGPSLLQYARVGTGRRIHIVDTTHVEVPLETGTYECSGVVKNDDGSRSRGYKLATLRTLLDHAGLITQVGLCPIQVHDLPLCRLFVETAPVLRAGDLVLEDRGFVDG